MRKEQLLKNKDRYKLPGIVLIVLGAAFLAYFGIWATGKVIHWSFDMGVCLILGCGVLLTASGILLLRGGMVIWFKRHKAVRNVLLAVLALFLLSFGVVEGLVLHDAALNDSAVKADFVLIPGATVVQGRPSLVLRHRLDGAMAYINKNPGAIVIVSGGKGEGESFTEAEVMKKYLVQKGIDGKRIIEEGKATNTIENVAYTKQIIDGFKLGWEPKLVIVTNDFHMFRAMLLARAQGLDAYGISVPIHYSVAPICYCREYFSVLKLFLTGLHEE
jgi:uncharacterized SAM-binding protein YcdF (DUF218 family)